MDEDTVFLSGESVDLCVPDKELHADCCLKWINDPEVSSMLLIGVFPISGMVEKEWLKVILEDKDDIMLIVVTREGKPIGTVGLYEIDFTNRMAKINVLIGEKDEWGRGYGSEAERLLIEFAFSSLKLLRITRLYCEQNIASKRVGEKNGFTEEGLLRGQFCVAGEYVNIMRSSIFKNEFEVQKSYCG